jgi:hypothetical protein
MYFTCRDIFPFYTGVDEAMTSTTKRKDEYGIYNMTQLSTSSLSNVWTCAGLATSLDEEKSNRYNLNRVPILCWG